MLHPATIRRWAALPTLTLSTLGLLACTSGVDPGVDDPLGWALEVVWEPCPLRSEGSEPGAECADIEVPLHWSEPEGEPIRLFVRRYPGTPGGGQVWGLAGGPGQAGSDFEPLMTQLEPLDPDRTYYMLDHRGVGRSSRLRCASSEGLTSPNGVGIGEGELEACLEDVRESWTDAQLAGFSTTNAAHDLGELIEHLRSGDEEVALWGGSYGTIWLERYLALYPDQPSSVAYSAIAIDVDLLTLDRSVDEVTRRWLDACDGDDSCGPRFRDTFGRSAREVVTEAFGGQDKALCDEIQALDLDIPTFKPFFGQIFNDIQGRSLYAPIVYRLARCAPEDVAAIAQMATAFTPPGGPTELPLTIRNWGFVLGENVAVSELTSDRPAGDVLQDYEDAIAVQGNTPRLAEAKAVWPAYEPPDFELSEYQGSMLLLHGEYDFLPRSAYERTVDHYLQANPSADFLLVPGAPHSLESPTSDGSQCAINLIISRLLDPDATLDDCAQRILEPRFAPDGPVSFAVFGTTDPWEGDPR